MKTWPIFSALGLHHVAEGIRGWGMGAASALRTVKEVTTLSDGRKEKFLRALAKIARLPRERRPGSDH